ncbi:transposase family protein [uncultured Propionibacterium sp.]|uniref:transposase family protein n=1 Tax=uncultured Propionibacterium sp. TaxID=218066 RepID=UPI00292F3C70|nr:transposase family protein [uncultured Propionibacterium sp.]
MFATVPDPRGRRGVRHRLDTILALAVVTVLADCRTLLAAWEHMADLSPDDLACLGIDQDRPLPSESTIRRVLQDQGRRRPGCPARRADVHPYRHHRRTPGDRRGRQDHARRPAAAARMVTVQPRT